MKNNNKLTVINEILFQELERLNNDAYMDENFEQKIKRSSALQKTALSVVRIAETNIKLLDAADRHNTTIERMNDFLGLNEAQRKDNK